VLPWLILALLAVAFAVAGVAARRRMRGAEHPAGEGAEEGALLTEQEFAAAEAYDAEWREEDKERYHQERLP
jgi:hypothetical protein